MEEGELTPANCPLTFLLETHTRMCVRGGVVINVKEIFFFLSFFPKTYFLHLKALSVGWSGSGAIQFKTYRKCQCSIENFSLNY